MRLKKTLSVLFIMAMTYSSFAHAIWIETATIASLGKPHAIKIFYGEYAAQEFEKTDKWYSDVNTFTLWLVAPDEKKTQLTYSAKGDHYVTTFTPDQQGVYALDVSQTAKDIDHGYVYQFNASAIIAVGKLGTVPATEGEFYLRKEKDPNGKSVTVKAFFKGHPAADIAIAVSGPTGWSKNFKTDKNGVLQFEPLWKGTYALEGTFTVDEAGIRNEKQYEHFWRCATLTVAL